MLKRNLFVLLAIIGIALIPIARSATSYTVFNVPPMRLNEGISATATSFDVAAPIRNGAKVNYPALGGGILELKNSRFQEYIYYASATVNSTTQVVTMTGAVRGYCWDSNTFASCEAGRVWAKGTQVTLVNDMRLFNFTAKTDTGSVMTGSGVLRSDQTSQPFLFLKAHTTAQINAFTYNGESGDRPITYDDTEGCWKGYDGASWACIASGSLINATTAARGVVTIASTGAALTGSGQGIGGSFNVLQADYATASGGLSIGNQIGYAAVTEDTGFLSGALLGQGCAGGDGLLMLTNAQTCVAPSTLVSVGSGANLEADDSVANPTLDSGENENYTQISASLSESITVSSGATTLFIFNGAANATEAACQPDPWLEMNVQKDGVELAGSGGIIKFDFEGNTGVIAKRVAVSFTYAYLNRSAGTFTFRPVGRRPDPANGGDTCTIQFDDNTSFQAINFE